MAMLSLLTAALAIPHVAAGDLKSPLGQMPLIAFGAGDTHCSPDCAGAVAAALRLGFRHVDTAYEYGTQAAVGAGLRRAGLQRQSVWLTTKIPGPVGATRVQALLDQALQEMGTGYIDLLLMHYPCLAGWPDPRDACSAEDGAEERSATWHAMEAMQRQGKTRHIGVSNFHLRHLHQLLGHAASVPFVNQVEWHLGWHDEELLNFSVGKGIQLQAYSPLGGGGTTTGHNGGVSLDDPVVVKVARNHNKSLAQVALRWSLDKGVAVVTATTNPRHMQSDLNVLSFSLTPEEVSALSELKAVVPSVQILDDWPDVTLPVLGLGTRPCDLQNRSIDSAVHAFAAQGGRYFDVAPGSEAKVGGSIDGVLSTGVAARDELFVSVKVPRSEGAHATRELVLQQLLPALNLGYADLLLLGAGTGQAKEELVLETWKAMEALQTEGHVRSLGVVNFTVKELARLLPHVRHTSGNKSIVAVNQVEWHLGWHDEDLLNFCNLHGITLQATSPLGGQCSQQPGVGEDAKPLVAAAQRHHTSKNLVALRWALQRGLPLVAASGAAGHSQGELEALFDFLLSPEEMRELDELRPAAGSLSSLNPITI